MPEYINTQTAYQTLVKKLGGKKLAVECEGLLLWPDGTTTSINMDLMNSPPTDEYSHLKAKLRYVLAKQKSEMSAFARFQGQQVTVANNAVRGRDLPAPRDDATELLTAGKKRIQDLQVKIEEYQLGMAGTPEGQAKAAERQRESDRIGAIAQTANQIESVSL